MPCAAAEVNDVRLRDAHVFEQHPRRVRKLRDFDSGKFEGPTANRVVEAKVRSAAFQQEEQVIAQRLIDRLRSRSNFFRGLGCSRFSGFVAGLFCHNDSLL